MYLFFIKMTSDIRVGIMFVTNIGVQSKIRYQLIPHLFFFSQLYCTIFSRFFFFLIFFRVGWRWRMRRRRVRAASLKPSFRW